LKNLILIDACDIDFASGLTILSGETGSGKTAITEGLALCLGARADSTCVRKGEEKALVEAAFEVDAPIPFLEDFDPSELLLIRREISKEGKSRAFINGQMAPLSLLQKLGSSLIDLVNQHAHVSLEERDVIDLYGNLQEELKKFQETWAEEKALEEKKQKLEAIDLAWEKERCAHQLSELEKIAYQEGEEETLFEEYKQLADTLELSQKLNAISLEDFTNAITRYKSLSPLQALTDLLHEATVSLQEASFLLSRTLGTLDVDTARYTYLEERLSILDRLKKKYGKGLTSVKRELEQKHLQLENLSEEKLTLSEHLEKARESTKQAAAALTRKRKEAAEELAPRLTKCLQELNMPHAKLTIELSSQSRSSTGEDLCAFWLQANQGELAVLAKTHSSGGELCRLLLAIKTVLAEKNNTPTIIFDEVDANIGGETAARMAEKLSMLGRQRQVICITHFPQVAAKADHHLVVRKQETPNKNSEGVRTLTTIQALTPSEREKELLRMLGGLSATLIK
jgi:DNA repair protein RecN (Recombination protein N)